MGGSNTPLTDLHCQSTASDGELPPERVVRLAAEAGVVTLALTDHDTLDGVSKASDAAKAAGIELVPGIELSVRAPSGSMHLLGYFRELGPQPLAAELSGMRRRRADRARVMVEKLGRLGIDIDYADVEARAAGPIGRPHVAEALVAAGHVADRQEAFDRYLADRAPAHTPHKGFGPQDAVRLIAESGGAPVLAHPNTLAMAPGELDRLVAGLRGAGLAGIEVHRSDHTLDDRRRLGALADRHGLVPSGGSDFHRPGEDRLGDTGSPALPIETAQLLLGS